MQATAGSEPRLSVIIVSYECRDLLAQCLDALETDPLRTELELIVVDNASADGSADLVRRRYPAVRLIENETNAGFPAANNQALAIARSPALLLLNPDAVVTSGAVSAILDFLEREPRVKVAGPDVRNVDGTPQHTTRLIQPGAVQFILEQVGIRRAAVGEPAHTGAIGGAPQRVASVSGSALAFTRAVVDRIGGFDEEMFWAEDLDFCIRAGEAGIPVFHLPAARILHHGGQSGKRNLRRMLYAQHASRISFAERHYGMTAGLVLRAAFAALLPAKMAVRSVQLSSPSKRADSRARIAGYWDALRFCFLRH
ncbi:MAG TPA: glycosyltransferase family 2 protein [Gemmatimonadaceae bacterium]|nr:glycosyltransferase family 2 protein [Gemmatimonadaceae bacterium]